MESSESKKRRIGLLAILLSAIVGIAIFGFIQWNLSENGTPTPPGTTPEAAKRTVDDEQQKATQLAELSQATKSRVGPLVLYGRIEDQLGNPVKGATIQGVITKMGVASEAIGVSPKKAEFSTTSNDDGSFKIDSKECYSIRIESIKASGYHLPPPPRPQMSFMAADADTLKLKPETPARFTLISEAKSEPLIEGMIRKEIMPNTLYSLDLMDGKLVPGGDGGDVQIYLNRPKDAARGKPFFWEIKIDVPNGGLAHIPKDDPLAFTAPEDGYQKASHWGQKVSDEWTDRDTVRAFLQLRSGKAYGKIEMQVYAIYGLDTPAKSLIHLEYRVNPKASRTLVPTASTFANFDEWKQATGG